MADEKNGSSDLDIFEGLGKKAPAAPVSVTPPPPPASAPPAPVDGKRTLLGIPQPTAQTTAQPTSTSQPAAQPSVPPARPVSPSQPGIPATRSAPPPPPPGRGSLPAIAKPEVAPAAPATSPQNGAGGKLEMDWDDDEEATHVFDKEEKDAVKAGPAPAAGAPAAGAPAAGSPASMAPATTPTTTRGTGAPPPPPPAPASMKPPAPTKSAPPPLPKTGSIAPPPPPPASAAPPAPPPPPPASAAPPATSPLAPPPAAASAPPPPPPASMRPPPPPPASMPPPPPPPAASVPPPPPPPPASGNMQAAPIASAASIPSAPPPLATTLASAPPPQVTTAPMPLPPKPASLPPMPAASPVAVSQPPAQSQPPAYAQPSMAPRSMEQTALVRPAPQSRGWVGLGLGLLAVAIAAGTIVYFVIPKTGSVAVNVSDAKGGSLDHVDVFVDGKKECETTPCTIKRDSGNHSIKVVAAGYETPEPKQVSIESGKEASVAFTLSRGGSGGTGMRVGSATTGLKLYVDGELVGALPQELRTLPAGDHKIKITGGERYQTLEKTVSIAKGEMLDMSNVALKVLHGKATIESAPPGARVFIVSGSDRRELPRLPLSVELDTSRSWTLEAQRFGSPDFKQPIVFEDGQAEKSFTISFDAKAPATLPGPATPGPAVGPAPTAPTPAPTSAPSATPSTTPSAKPSSDAPAGQATLNFQSIPPSAVILDGRPVGQTPKMGVSVSPGAHTVVFKNTDQGLSKTVGVNVKAGETKTVAAKLRD